jgi:diguanylate cyclase (GGDEF)-like protein
MKLKGSKILDREQIHNHIRGGLNYVHFSKSLEPEYRNQYCQGAAYEFRFRGAIILCLYIYLSFGIYQTIPDHQVSIAWFKMYVWVGVIITLAWVMSFIPQLNRYFDLYTCLGSLISVTITFVIVAHISSDINNVLIHASMMYAIVIIYGLVGMRFYTALIAGWGGGVLGISICHIFDLNIGWTVLHRTYTFSSFLGMALVYATDRQLRANFLQHCIIEINQDELLQQSALLEQLSQQDSLTGLANRRHLTEILDQQWRYAVRYQEPLGLLMIDIDYFKIYNDELGHLAGDECLKVIATALKDMTKRSGDVAARYGGEEFMLVLPMTNTIQIQRISKLLIQNIRALEITHPKSPISPYITISIGAISIVPSTKDSLIQVIDLADQALYQAKSMGRNQYYLFTSDACPTL